MNTHEPSNAELMTLLRHHVEQSESRDRAQTERMVSMRQEIKTEILQVRNQQAEFNQRLVRVEEKAARADGEARRALNSNADLEGRILAEVGALAANDRKQNTVLAKLVVDVGEVVSWKRVLVILVCIVPGLWAALQWAVEQKTPPERPAMEQHR